jgi:flagellar L-ring protein FlgH
MKRQDVSMAVLAIAGVAAAGAAYGQSSSLYVQDPAAPQQGPAFASPATNPYQRPHTMARGLATTSYLAVPLPEPKVFAVHDLITIIIRESTENDSKHQMDTKKQLDLKGELSDFPAFRLPDLLEMQLKPSSAKDNPVKVTLKGQDNYKGDAELKQKDTFTSRLSARIIDVKPNGTLVLEARRYIQTDDEVMDIVLTGTCRKEDITVDNTVLSTQLADLRLKKLHKGEMRKTTKKGILTQIFEAIFNF